ncbi:prolyl oligopeptidase family serine peptidase [Solimonas marina]|nr:prolyl oligopeptidase family serine peptidase [Solimonas marina]
MLSLARIALATDTFGYQLPPSPIPQMLDAPQTPAVGLDRQHHRLAIYGRESMPSIAALAEPVLRLAGHRINPRNDGPTDARSSWMNQLILEDIASGARHDVTLPSDARFTNPSWSPDGRWLALTLDTAQGLELWVVDSENNRAQRLSTVMLNATLGRAYQWLPDSSGLVARTVVTDRGPVPAAPTAPEGPIVQQSNGVSAATRTYEDLLKGPYDEALFDYYFTSQLARISIDGGVQKIGAPAVIADVDISPDGRYLLIASHHHPYSYLVTSSRFPTRFDVTDLRGQLIHTIVDRPLAENLPATFDAVVAGPRAIEWRSDAPATLMWAQAQDGGDPQRKTAIHDRLYLQAAPFNGPARVLADLAERYRDIAWGNGETALVTTRWWKTRHETRLIVTPAHPGKARVLTARNYQDAYHDPGDPLLESNVAGHSIMHFSVDGRSVLVRGDGATRGGTFPFLAALNLHTGTSQRLWQSAAPYYESVVALADDSGRALITRRESADDVPNYYLRQLDAPPAQVPRALTMFADPAPQFAGVTKQLITYRRADGVQLSGTLYLPAGYDAKRDGPLPMLMWAYPTEYTDAAVAGQVVDKGNRFTRPSGASPLFLLTQGYAILERPAMPIIGAHGAEPNDTYVEQLVADAQAAVDAVVALGVADRHRIAIGGHSYGAFMTANLLAHSNLFQAGIARSGAYNRTLTPFGFQAEQRTYWQATGTYTLMSPFTYANRIHAPILLIHGMADDNSGTFPIQSERFYAALKGNGATVRYVQLPDEAHGYRARESVLHTLWEMNRWLDLYLKGAAPTSP